MVDLGEKLGNTEHYTTPLGRVLDKEHPDEAILDGFVRKDGDSSGPA